MDALTRGSYVPLLDDEKMSTDSIETGTQNITEIPKRYLWINQFFFLVITICTLVDVALIGSIAWRNAQQGDTKISSIDNLKIGNPYINLEALYREANISVPRYDPVINVGQGLVQVSLTDPHKVIPEYTETGNLSIGHIARFRRHLIATPTISTVAQFRIMDFGMESCSLVITVPDEITTRDTIVGPTGKSVVVHIHQIEVQNRLNLRKLSRSLLPPTRKHIASMVISYGKTAESGVFPYIMGFEDWESGKYFCFQNLNSLFYFEYDDVLETSEHQTRVQPPDTTSSSNKDTSEKLLEAIRDKRPAVDF
ncbi:hypothetical protein GALMADRAFT_215387 [Galerina marginata CBS 339.88]|uniref:Ubiquitin 3 binding protein But2 C-terminal domain-containing protein n=1 Tax=Galerina marginata (strain CBS 339.88) TaxID=685588 RepID=A0A067SQP4_GALM3|nr:hypothetical protein GALMADRAFT_215387 [Galerina marginata CBS 339.88]